jgi:uncharacterized protein (TIGR03083 family)
MSEPHAIVYGELRARVREVIMTADPAAFARPAPATPDWSAHDIVAHLVGVPDDVVHGRLEGIATDPWTQAQVDKRKGVATGDLVAEWDENGPAFEELLAAAPGEIAGQAIFDAAAHEHDLRHALGTPGARDSDAIALAWDWIIDARTRGGEPAVCFVVDGVDQVSGTGEIVARVAAPRFELFRAVSGRRAAAEIEQYQWDGEPDPKALIASTIFSLRDEPLGE